MPDQPIVATLHYTSAGLSIPLHQEETLILGRGKQLGIYVQHVSRKQLEVASKGAEVLVTRQGTNRSLLNGQELVKDQPTLIKNGDIISLLEKEYQITVEMPNSTAEQKPLAVNPVSADESAARQPGPSQEASGSVLPLDNVPLDTIGDWKAIHDDTVRRENLPRQGQDDTSDSEMEEELNRSLREARSLQQEDDSDVSNESSVICDDLSDIEMPHQSSSALTPVATAKEWATPLHHARGNHHIKHE
ncbi:hypothetical protein BGZ94_010420 [Podila epigama]|nr:hypothetical protein BGZ94_010420 [Podila epigama]